MNFMQNIKVLIVDDEQPARRKIGSCLTAQGGIESMSIS